MNYDSPVEIKKILNQFHLSLKKRWGQNFLINPGVRKKIIDLVTLKKGMYVWEIGPGLGTMTEPVLKAGAQLITFEIDWGMVRYLKQSFTSFEHFRIIQGDVVKTWYPIYKQHGKPDVVMGNLPYASASVIIMSFILKDLVPDKLVFIVQRELARRITAVPKTKNYSSFSILFQSAFSVQEKQDIKPGSFYPAPEVISSIIYAIPAFHNTAPVDKDLFFHLVKTGFKSRRKTLLNNLLMDKRLKTYTSPKLEEAIEMTGFKRKTRSEELRVTDFIHLANMLFSLKQQ